MCESYLGELEQIRVAIGQLAEEEQGMLVDITEVIQNNEDPEKFKEIIEDMVFWYDSGLFSEEACSIIDDLILLLRNMGVRI